ncbi:T9SS type A sorting domain-containing protein [Reichenbachiella sp.]|uniref:T9SS type A sorting domain-containing protein n=1 Tax=Reichenbachiella sp. TaxID=2184521 RepID=UPI00329A17BC
MRIHFILLFLAVHICLSISAQDSSLDNYTGDWTTDASWNSGTAPPFDNVIEDLTIYGYITLPAGNRIDLTNGGGDVLTIEDTLVIEDLTLTSRFFSGNTVIVNGLLIVMGNLNYNSGTTFTVNSGGVVAVGGNFGAFGGGDPTFGAGTIYVEGTSGYTDVSPADDLEGDGLGNVGDFLDGTSTELPVEMKYFSAEAFEGRVVLNWATASELNNEGFEVEKSENGIDYQKIGFVGGHGTVNEEKIYAFTDFFFDGHSYYKLKQIDFDGAFEYTEVIEARGQLQGDSELSISLNPVLGRSSLSLVLNQDTFARSSIKLISTSGRLIYSAIQVSNNYDFSYQIDLENERISRGHYILHVETTSSKYTTQVIVK